MRFYSSWRGFDMDDLELKVFQVQVKWHVFRIPVGKYPDVYDMLNDWLLENMTGDYKLFSIDGGESYIHGKRKIYNTLVEVDIRKDDDASLFKLRWLTC